MTRATHELVGSFGDALAKAARLFGVMIPDPHHFFAIREKGRVFGGITRS